MTINQKKKKNEASCPKYEIICPCMGFGRDIVNLAKERDHCAQREQNHICPPTTAGIKIPLGDSNLARERGKTVQLSVAKKILDSQGGRNQGTYTI